MSASLGVESLERRQLFSGDVGVGVDPIPLPGPVVAPPISVTTGRHVNGTLGVVSFPVAPAGQQQFQVRIDWGDGYVSHGQLTPIGNDQYDLVGAHVYDVPGNYTVNAQASYDAYPLFTLPGVPLPEIPSFPGRDASLQKMVTVSGAPVTSTLGGIVAHPVGSLTGYGGQLDSAELATLTGIQPDPLGADVYATVDDGQGHVQAFYANYADGQYVLIGTVSFGPGINQHNFVIPNGGVYDLNITFRLNDHSDPTKNTVLASTQDTLRIVGDTANGVDLAATAGVPFSGSVGTFTADPKRKLQDAIIFWGDALGDISPGTLVPLGNNQYSIVGTHTFGAGDTYGIHVQIDYTDGPPITDAIISTILVTPSAGVAPTPSAAPPPFGQTAVAGQPDAGRFSLPLDTPPVAPGLTALIRWGDGTRTIVPVGVDTGAITADASHIYRHAGKFNATVIYYSGKHVIGRVHRHVKVAHRKAL